MFAHLESPQKIINLGAERKHSEVREICYSLTSGEVKRRAVLGWATSHPGCAGMERFPNMRDLLCYRQDSSEQTGMAGHPSTVPPCDNLGKLIRLDSQ